MDTSIDYSELLDDTEQDVSKSHSKLLEAVSRLDKGQRVKKPERSEPTLEVSEFHLVKSGISDQDAVRVYDLAKALGGKSHHFELTKSLRAANKKAKVLPKPLEKPAADRIKRIVGFENTKYELKKWNAVISKNRVSESLSFPLNQSSVKFGPSSEFVKRFRIQSDLEKEFAKLEPQKENVERKEDEFSLTLREIIAKRKEAARIRARQSYKEAKARRERKIKSKKFHRVRKKEQIKQQLKEFEQLQKTDPAAALEKLQQLDRTRAEERMSLRHKNTGKWAKSKQIRAKFDKETQQELAQQLSIGRELTEKLKKPDDSEDEEDPMESAQPLASDKENPWLGNAKTVSEIDEFVKSYRKYWDTQGSELKDKDINVSTKCTIESKETISFSNDREPSSVSNDLPPDAPPSEVNSPTAVQEAESNASAKVTREPKKPAKRIKPLKRDSGRVVATSSWNVESVGNAAASSVIKCLKDDAPSSENLNRMFDFMEERMQNQIKSKLERVTQNYEKTKVNMKAKGKKRRKRRDVELEEDAFDGLEMQATRLRPSLDLGLSETTTQNDLEWSSEVEKARSLNVANAPLVDKSKETKIEIDPNKYININAKPKLLDTEMPMDITGGDEALDDSEEEKEQRNIVSEAFADDDVVEEFRKEKEEVVKQAQPEDIDLTLPGWGSWGGKNIKVSARKKRRFILKMPKDLPRKDENKGDVIIFEEDNPKIREHQVNELPHPFASVKDYEASVRIPIGRNFVPENAHRRLIEPTVKTRLGKVIEPMTEDALVKVETKKRRKFIPKKRNPNTRKRK